METFILDMLAQYGPNASMAIALVYIVQVFIRQLDRRDEVDKTERGELVAIIRNNTEAITELSMIIRDRRDSAIERRNLNQL